MEIILFSLGGGLIGGIVGYLLCSFFKVQKHLYDTKIKRRLEEQEAYLTDFKNRYEVKYNSFARTVSNALDLETPTKETSSAIPPELQAIATATGIDIEKLLKGDHDQIKKVEKLLGGGKNKEQLTFDDAL